LSASTVMPALVPAGSVAVASRSVPSEHDALRVDARETDSAAAENGNLAELAGAFRTFVASTQQLEEAYNGLRDRAQQIDTELAEVNESLRLKVGELNDVTNYLDSVLSSMHSGVVAVDLNGRIATINRAAERILGIPRARAIGVPYDALIRTPGQSPSAPGGAGSILPLALECNGAPRTLRRDIVVDVSCSAGADVSCSAGADVSCSAGPAPRASQQAGRLRPSNGLRRLTIESSISPVRNNRRELIGALDIFRDLSEITALECRLQQADRLATLGAVAAKIAHEVRNPLNAIMGFTGLLARDLSSDDPRRRFADNVISAARALERTVTSVLIFARPFRLRVGAVDVSALLDDVRLLLTQDAVHGSGAAGTHDPIRVVARCGPRRGTDAAGPDAPISLLGDADQLKCALLNLGRNSLQAMPGGGKIELTARTLNGTRPRKGRPGALPHATGAPWVAISVSDTGPGIPPEVMKNLFVPFISTKENGTGLGLCMVHKIVELHGGKIRADSRPGQGTVFTLSLPPRPPAQVEASAASFPSACPPS